MNDYSEFFMLNSSVSHEDGIYTTSWNEIEGEYDRKYYITYSRIFSDNPNANSDKANEMYKELEEVYLSLTEKP